MRRLPDGILTDDFDEYVDAWQGIANPIEDATGWHLYGFDPTLSFSNGKAVVQMPVDFAKDLSDALLEFGELLDEQFQEEHDHCPTKFKLGNCPSYCDIDPCPGEEMPIQNCEICGKEGGH